MKLKSAASDAIAAIGAIIGIVPALFKKKPFCLWYFRKETKKWEMKAGPFSRRQCEKTREALLSLGSYDAECFVILRKGVSP